MWSMTLEYHLILEQIRAVAVRPMKVKELAQALKVPKPQYSEFRTLVKKYIDKGDLVRLKRNRVGLATELNVIVGEISVTRAGKGFVPREGKDDVMISSSQMYTALDGDRVMVRLNGYRGEREVGSVIRILERAERKIVGTYHEVREFCFVRPDNPRLHRDIYIPPAVNKGAVEGEKVVAVLKLWDDPYLNPEGEIVERLGRPTDPGVDMLTVIKSFDLPEEFPDKVLTEAERAAVLPKPAELKGRVDRCGECIYTIDPADAKDHDDAVCVERTGDGYRLGVHIADVSHYVQPGTDLDNEAFLRGNSVYLPGMVIPMLPEVLSNDVCSLKPNRRRLAHSVVIDFNKNGKMLSWEVQDTVMKSSARLSYEEVQDFFDGNRGNPRIDRVGDNLEAARELARILSERRFAAGSLDFDLPEAKIVMNERGEVLELGHRVRLESHRLVEEFMLAANRAVALEVFRKAQPFLYRVHERPNMEKMHEFSAMMNRLGYKFPVSPNLGPIHFARFLNKVQDKPEVDFINELMLRSMMKAVYQAENIGHFGLAFKHYTHFTSPIRRYPDLLVHRMLRALKGSQYEPEYARRIVSVIKNVGTHCSETERTAESAERAAVKIKQVSYLSKQVGSEYRGVISGVASFGFFVRLENMAAEGIVRLSSMDDDYYVFEENQYRLVGRRTGKIYRMGDPVDVGVLKVDTLRHEVELYVVDTHAEPPASQRKKPAKTKTRTKAKSRPRKETTGKSNNKTTGKKRKGKNDRRPRRKK